LTLACRDDGLAVFNLVRHWANGGTAFLYAFNLNEFNGDVYAARHWNVAKPRWHVC
jgi:hypothetical protein